jgi:hypothetical protein
MDTPPYSLADLKAIILDPQNSDHVKLLAINMVHAIGMHDQAVKRCLEVAAGAL